MKKINWNKIGKIARYTWVTITLFFALGEPTDERYWWVQIINVLHFILALVVSAHFEPEGEEPEDYSDF